MILRFVLALALAGAVGVVGFGYGYISGDTDNSFAKTWIKRFARKIDEIRGLPLPEERALERIESTFIRFRGSLYPLPDSHFKNGGALTQWDGTLFVVDREGSVFRFVEGEGLVATEIGTPEHGDEAYAAYAVRPENADRRHRPERLRYNDIEFVETPTFRGLLVSYNFFDADRVCYGNRVAKLPISPDQTPETLSVDGSDWDVFFETEPCLGFRPAGIAMQPIQAGGRMDMHPDGRLIYGSGDFAFDGFEAPDIGLMDPDVQYGNILAIDIDTGAAETIAVGHRNMQGIAVDRDGEIWSIEHGVRGGDELNHIKQGENHGWPLESLGTLYSGQPFPFQGAPGRHDIYDRPVFAWLPSAGTSALEAIDDFHPTWDGGLLVGSLSSPQYGQSLYHVRTDGDTVVFVERIRLSRRVRDIEQFGKRLALWLDTTDLLILEQVPRADPFQLAATALNEAHPDVADEVVEILRSCNECHAFEQDVHAAGPSLNSVVGREIAGTGFSGYSDALRSASGSWTPERLRAYLVDPTGAMPGTSMPAMGLSEGPELDGLITALERMNTADGDHLTY